MTSRRIPLSTTAGLRKYYQLTDSGRQHIVDFLDDWKSVVSVIDFY